MEALRLPVALFFKGEEPSRLFYPFLISALVLAYFVFKKSNHQGSFWGYVFNRKTWWGASAKVDYFFLFLNAFVKVFLIGPYLFSAGYLAIKISDFLQRFMGSFTLTDSKSFLLICYTASLLIVKDFFVFLIHYLMHHVPALWKFHQVHHSATRMNPLTQFRIHPVELALNNVFSLFAIALVTGVFDYLSKDGIEIIMALGANVFLVLFKLLGANLRHSHVKLKYPSFLETYFISPYQHQIHHSNNPKFFNKNLGSALAIWDYLFGSLSKSRDLKRVHFGLGAESAFKKNTFLEILFVPFLQFLKGFRRKR